MRVIPRLNLNKHPYECMDGSLIDATNFIVSKDNAVLQTEPAEVSSPAYTALREVIGETETSNVYFNIKFTIPCNTEIIFFIQSASTITDKLKIYRYNEDKQKAVYQTEIDYSGGTIVGVFTYNTGDLVIAFSEYFEDDSHKIPLRVINLGQFDTTVRDGSQLTKKALHPACPEVIIPNIGTTYIDGLAYKGWYYIFVRYKISTNTYTQWFNTNESIFIDEYSENRIFDYYVGKDQKTYDVPSVLEPFMRKKYPNTESFCTALMSDEKDICTVSFKCTIANADSKYDKYQLAFVCVSKSYTKCFRSHDIDVASVGFTFDRSYVIEYGVEELITSYTNYYNAKAITTTGNRLYIGNFLEKNEENLINSLSNIRIDITCNRETITDNYTPDDGRGPTTQVGAYLDGSLARVLRRWEDTTLGFTGNDAYYVDFRVVPTLSVNNSHVWEEFKGNEVITIKMVDGGTTDTQDYYIYDILYFYNQKQFYIYNINGELLPAFSGASSTARYYWTHSRGTLLPEPIEIVFGDYTYQSITETIDTNIFNRISTFTTVGMFPEQMYNFFIHFVDKYGVVTRGYNLSCFDTALFTYLFSITNNIGNKLIYIKDSSGSTNELQYTLSFTISSIPDGYSGWFVSYEKFEKTIVYNGIGTVTPLEGNNVIKVYNDCLNYDDTIDLHFDKIRIKGYMAITNSIEESSVTKDLWVTNDTVKIQLTGSYADYDIVNKELFVADNYNNLLKSTHLKITVDGSINISSPTDYLVELYRSDTTSLYCNKSKTLIPCSTIGYVANGAVPVNPKNAFRTYSHAMIYRCYFYSVLSTLTSDTAYYNDTIKAWQYVNTAVVTPNPLVTILFKTYESVPVECLQFNNKPDVIFYPFEGLNTTSEQTKSFFLGSNVDVKDSIDLFQQKQTSVDTSYPKTLINYDAEETFETKYTNVIRRSDVLQNENYEVSWRKFGLENYKIINENKGAVIKLVSIGYYFIAHTKHSMFLFNASDSIKSNENKDIQLASIDIWDVDYKEVITSQLGYAGIQHETHGIIGTFGYIFWDKDSRHLFRYDDNNIKIIDTDIQNFTNKLSIYDIELVDDKKHNRILMRFYNQYHSNYYLSYNYNTDTFVSRHDGGWNFGTSTKDNIYLIGNMETYNTPVYEFSTSKFKDAIVKVLINTDYVSMKYLEYILYKVSRVTSRNIDDFSPVEGIDYYYAGSNLRIYTAGSDTGQLDVTIDNATMNKPMDYAKPYWRFGNWHFNAIRNKLAQYLQGDSDSDLHSRVYGNWFVIQFSFNVTTQVELETIDCKFVSAENI